MGHLEVLTYEETDPQAQEILSALKKKLGKIPNIFAAMAASPATLKALLTLKETMGKAELTSQEAEAIALVIGQQNGCDYCLAAHTAIGKMQGLSADEIKKLRRAESEDEKRKALVVLTQEIVATQGHPRLELIDAFYAAGYSKAALIALIGHVAVNIFTNYFNHIAQTPIDFPPADDFEP